MRFFANGALLVFCAFSSANMTIHCGLDLVLFVGLHSLHISCTHTRFGELCKRTPRKVDEFGITGKRILTGAMATSQNVRPLIGANPDPCTSRSPERTLARSLLRQTPETLSGNRVSERQRSTEKRNLQIT
ncbi:hypothetical protein F2P81_020444 [Scophthalmus maximus]|uniref:Secreted protein n=1 Tax=Scophthalmus maximus TaxID=52904 RepID=A0A6A4S002_SCOMX|nr:hypothetical protein F2P81_020444 [Scophthalmus maximus]